RSSAAILQPQVQVNWRSAFGFPVVPIRARQVLIPFGLVRKPKGFRVEPQCLARKTSRDVPDDHRLGKGTGVVEVRRTLLLPPSGADADEPAYVTATGQFHPRQRGLLRTRRQERLSRHVRQDDQAVGTAANAPLPRKTGADRLATRTRRRLPAVIPPHVNSFV